MLPEDIRHPEKQPNSWKVGRKKYKRQKKETKEGGRDFGPGKIVLKRENFQTPGKLFTAKSLPSFGSTKGNIRGFESFFFFCLADAISFLTMGTLGRQSAVFI